MMYDDYNREERALCAHLFRLLHEWVTPTGNLELMTRFLNQSGHKVGEKKLGTISIYTEVALIRDAYFSKKPGVESFMDDYQRK